MTTADHRALTIRPWLRNINDSHKSKWSASIHLPSAFQAELYECSSSGLGIVGAYQPEIVFDQSMTPERAHCLRMRPYSSSHTAVGTVFLPSGSSQQRESRCLRLAS